MPSRTRSHELTKLEHEAKKSMALLDSLLGELSFVLDLAEHSIVYNRDSVVNAALDYTRRIAESGKKIAGPKLIEARDAIDSCAAHIRSNRRFGPDILSQLAEMHFTTQAIRMDVSNLRVAVNRAITKWKEAQTLLSQPHAKYNPWPPLRDSHATLKERAVGRSMLQEGAEILGEGPPNQFIEFTMTKAKAARLRALGYSDLAIRHFTSALRRARSDQWYEAHRKVPWHKYK